MFLKNTQIFRGMLLRTIAALTLFSLPLVASAQDSPLDRARGVAGAGGISTGTSLPVLVGNIISAALGLLGVVMVVLIIYAGFLYLTAAGDDKKVDTAKAIIKNAIIGAVLIFTAYAITSFVVRELTRDRTVENAVDGAVNELQNN